MRPRTRELLETAERRLRVGQLGVRADPSASISLAYYAMLNAARAALSERDLFVGRHGGTWQLFRETFVEDGEFDADLTRRAAASQEAREGADYGARRFSQQRAREMLELAERFLTAVRQMIEE